MKVYVAFVTHQENTFHLNLANIIIKKEIKHFPSTIAEVGLWKVNILSLSRWLGLNLSAGDFKIIFEDKDRIAVLYHICAPTIYTANSLQIILNNSWEQLINKGRVVQTVNKDKINKQIRNLTIRISDPTEKEWEIIF